MLDTLPYVLAVTLVSVNEIAPVLLLYVMPVPPLKSVNVIPASVNVNGSYLLVELLYFNTCPLVGAVELTSPIAEAVSPAQQAAIAISKKERGEKPKNEAVNQDDHGEKINQDKKDAAMKKTDQKKDFKSLRAETKIIKLGDKGKTATGKDAGAIDVEPSAKPI